MRILVTGAGALLGQGIIRALQHSRLDATIIGADPSPLSAGLYWAHRRKLLPFATDPSFLEAFRNLLREERPDVVLVGTDVELIVLARHRAALEAEFGVKVLVSDERVVGIADDKWLTYRFLVDAGFDFPVTALPGTEERLIDEVGFPLLVKPRVGARSIGVRVVHSRGQLQAALANTNNPVIQEYVATESDEYTAGVVAFPDQPPVSIVMRRDLRDGNTYRAFVEPFDDLNERVKKLALALRPFGPVNFQFRLAGSRVKVFEINARFSGTTPLRARVGFNEVEIAVRHLLEGVPVTPPAIQTNVAILRYWTEDVIPCSTIAETGVADSCA